MITQFMHTHLWRSNLVSVVSFTINVVLIGSLNLIFFHINSDLLNKVIEMYLCTTLDACILYIFSFIPMCGRIHSNIRVCASLLTLTLMHTQNMYAHLKILPGLERGYAWGI